MKKLWIIGLCISLVFACSSCQKGGEVPNQSKVATSIFPIYDIVKQVVGDEIDVIYTVPAGANPHTYEPSVSVVKTLQAVEIFIGINDHLDGWVKEFLPENCEVVFLAEESESHAVYDEHGHVHSLDREHESSHAEDEEENPHVWLSVRRTRDLVAHVTELLRETYPDFASTFNRNARSYDAELAQLDSEIESALSQVATRSFIQWHPAWDYFADDYGLKIIGTLEQGHGDEPSVKDMNDLVRKGRRGDVKTIVIGLGVESKAAQALAREISGRIVRLDTMGDPENPKKSSYIAMMKDNVRLLAAALNEDENQNE